MATCDVTTKRSEEVTFTIIMRQICTPRHRGKKQPQCSLCGQILSLSPQQISSYFYSLPSYRIFTVQVPSPWPLATARAAAGKSHDLQLAAARTADTKAGIRYTRHQTVRCREFVLSADLLIVWDHVLKCNALTGWCHLLYRVQN